ncbi:MAG TPA: ABC transporter substrate-binding protein [Acidimicrobiia bacterium]
MPTSGELSRRQFMARLGMTGVSVLGGGALLAACGDDAAPSTTAGGPGTTAGGPGTTQPAGSTTTGAGVPTGRTIKIGYVSPQTGPIAAFGEADGFVIDGIRAHFADGIDVGGTVHPVEILTKDSQSDPTSAGDAAADLILDDGVDLMVVASTPETTNPVSDQCELNGVPCISTVAPWQPWFFGRNGDPAVGFGWTYHFFWGLEGLIPQFIALWDKLDTNKMVGGLFPNDGDGLAWGDAELGFPPALEGAGYTLLDPGRYENLSDDFSAQIDAFKDAGVQIVTGVPIPPDFTTFWTQASQQGLTPLAATIGKAILYPANVEALDGDSGDGLSSEVWWSPSHPFRSSLTGAGAEELVAAYTSDTGRQWTQIIGFGHALFEVAANVLSRTADIDDKASILDAVAKTTMDSIVGPIDWTGGGPVPNVSTTPLVGGQWRLGGDFKYEMQIVDNSLSPDIPTTGEIAPIGG